MPESLWSQAVPFQRDLLRRPRHLRRHAAALTPAVRGALTRYRVIAYVVGVMLLVLLFVAMPLKYFGDNPAAMNVVGPLHGFLYVVYLLGTFDLFRRVRWSLPRLS